MKTKELITYLHLLDKNKIWVMTTTQLSSYFDENSGTLKKSLKRHVEDGLIIHLYKGLYANAMPSSMPDNALFDIIKYLRPKEINYLSFETVLSWPGIISQIPYVLTCATSGKSAWVKTAVGEIEFVHVPIRKDNRIEQIYFSDLYGVHVAKTKLAWLDLQYINRNIHMVDQESLIEEIGDEL